MLEHTLRAAMSAFEPKVFKYEVRCSSGVEIKHPYKRSILESQQARWASLPRSFAMMR